MNEPVTSRELHEPHVMEGGAERSGSYTGLLRQFVDETALLIRKELALAAAEVKQSVGDLKSGAGELVAGGAVLYAGVLFLFAAAASALSLVVPEWAARLIVGVIVAIIGAVMLQAGKKKFSSEHFVPDRTKASLRKDQEAVKRHTP